MKVMLSAFAVAIMLAATASFVLDTEVQMTAYQRFVTSGAQLNPGEAGINPVGPNWNGLGRPSAH